MILNIEDNIVNTNNIVILRKEVQRINTSSFIPKSEYCISINGVNIKFSTEQDRDIWYNTIERAMASE